MTTAFKTANFLIKQVKVNLEDIIFLLNMKLKAISVAAAMKEIEVAT